MTKSAPKPSTDEESTQPTKPTKSKETIIRDKRQATKGGRARQTQK